MFRSTNSAAWSDAAWIGLVISGKWLKECTVRATPYTHSEDAGERDLGGKFWREQDVIDHFWDFAPFPNVPGRPSPWKFGCAAMSRKVEFCAIKGAKGAASGVSLEEMPHYRNVRHARLAMGVIEATDSFGLTETAFVRLRLRAESLALEVVHKQQQRETGRQKDLVFWAVAAKDARAVAGDYRRGCALCQPRTAS